MEKEIGYFKDLLKRCTEQTRTPDEAIDCMCEELNQSNPLLAKAVKAGAYSVAGQLEGEVESGLQWTAGTAAVPGILAVLRLISRALEATALAAKLTPDERGKGRP